jgi:hypothetical protein
MLDSMMIFSFFVLDVNEFNVRASLRSSFLRGLLHGRSDVTYCEFSVKTEIRAYILDELL